MDLHTLVSEQGDRTEHVTYVGDETDVEIKRLLRILRCRGAHNVHLNVIE